MKNLFLVFVCIYMSNGLIAQNESIPVSVGYFGNFLIQPGVKVGTQFELKSWQTEQERRKKNITKVKSYFVSPQVGFFTKPYNNINFLLNADIGYQRVKVERNTFSSVSIGLGYLMESEVISIVYNLSDGSINKKNRELRNYFLPMINYEFGKIINSKLSWYSKFSFGSKLSTNRESSLMLFFETGMKFNLRKN